MRYYLDTNILIFILLNEDKNIDRHVWRILKDYSNVFYVSAVVVRELIHAYKAGDIKDAFHKTIKDLLASIEASGIEIKPLNKYHLYTYAELEAVPNHKDPNDHIIIAQAISDKIPIISSDHKFKLYTSQGLDFIFNKR
ncbi:MAG: PIN domain-containing protein [Tannerellaceae bacterium]|nr:PIN domain-containing protein [Tannerellaceae bacterium]